MKAKVLFVDDEVRIVRLLAMMFRKDYELFTATSGDEAVEIIRTHRPHVIVSDQRMPKMTGIELLSIAREIVPDSVRILLTGYSDLVAIVGAINEGEVYRFLNKPWNKDELTTVLAEAAAMALRTSSLPVTIDEVDQLSDVSLLASATKLLAIDSVAKDRHEVMEMFMEDYTVLGAPTFDQALSIMEHHEVGVVVAELALDDTTEMLAKLRQDYPSTTVVLLAHSADSPTIIRLINEAHIYRFAMKPMAPSSFRLAVAAAMKEHHRRLAQQHHFGQVSAQIEHLGCQTDTLVKEQSLADGIISSLGRFTKIW